MKKSKINNLFKTSKLKLDSSMRELLFDFRATAIDYVTLSLWSFHKDFQKQPLDVLEIFCKKRSS